MTLCSCPIPPGERTFLAMNPAGMRKRWTVISLLAVVFIAAYVSALFSFRAESTLELRFAGVVPPVPDYVIVQLDILEIDPALQKVWLRLIPEPAGGLRERGRPVPTRALTLRADGARVSFSNASTEGRTATVYAPGQTMTPTDVIDTLTNGSVGNFPFDRYQFNFRLSVTTPDPAAPQGYRHLPVIIQAAPDAGLAGFTFTGAVSRVEVADAMTSDAVELDITVRRSPTTFRYTILLMTIAGALALGCTAVALVVAFDPRYFQPAFLPWMSATLFAIVGLRRILPGNPPFGSLPDFLVFMWAETLVALALISLVINYLRRKPPPVP